MEDGGRQSKEGKREERKKTAREEEMKALRMHRSAIQYVMYIYTHYNHIQAF